MKLKLYEPIYINNSSEKFSLEYDPCRAGIEPQPWLPFIKEKERATYTLQLEGVTSSRLTDFSIDLARLYFIILIIINYDPFD